MSRESVEIFGLTSVADYLRITEQAVTEFSDDKVSVLRCISAMLLLNHIPDWLDGKLRDADRAALGWASGERTSAKDFFEAAYPDLTLVRSIANGVKHLRIREATREVSGYGQGAYGIGPYGKPYLVVDLGDDKAGTDRWVVADDLASRVLSWWKSRLATVLNA